MSTDNFNSGMYGPEQDQSDQWDGLTYRGERGDPEVPDEIYRAHPDARMATKKDGLGNLILALIIGGTLLLISIVGLIITMHQKTETEAFFEKAVPTPAVITNSWTHYSSTGNRRRAERYVGYQYRYNGMEYKGAGPFSESYAASVGVYGKSVKGQTITVYVDPKLPSESRIQKEIYFLHYFAIAGIVLFSLALIKEIRFYFLCKSGRVVYYDNGKRRKWKTIKKSKGS